MPICKRCKVMRSSAEMRETAKVEKVDFEKAGKTYKGVETHWVCRDKRTCKERRQMLERVRISIRENAEILERLRDA
jgi:hypothetical protein